MTDLTMSVEISRTSLGLAALEINDHTSYIVAGPEFLGGQVAWDRSQVSSPFVDGEVTTHRRRQNVSENIAVEVLGDNTADLQSNTRAIIDAFSQDSFTLTVELDSSTSVYLCEAADYKVVSSGPRYVANQLQVVFAVPRKPMPISGDI